MRAEVPGSRSGTSVPKGDGMIRRFTHGSVRREASPLWYVKGWRRDGKRYFGYFRASGRQWPGEIIASGSDFDVFIEGLSLSSVPSRHQACFTAVRSSEKGAVFKIHQNPKPRSPEEAIHAVEKILEGRS
jgi:hypothetical protein